MRKSYIPNVTCKFLLSFFFLFSAISGLRAQIDIPIGTGTGSNTGTTYPAPLQDYYEGSRSQYLYRASELTAAGMQAGNINAIKYNVTNLNGFGGTVEQMSVKIGTTALTTLNLTSWVAVPNTVLGPVDFIPAAGVNTLTFSTPFFWNGTDNIVVEICNGDPNNSTSVTYTENPSFSLTTGLGFNASHTYVVDNAGNACNATATANTGTATSRPNIIFNWVPAAACSGTPNPGTIATTSGSLCFGQTFTLTASGVTVASGLTYQWESSSDNVNWTPVNSANSLSYTTSQTVTTYYRFKVTCGATSATSNVVSVISSPLRNGVYTINNNGPAVPPNFQSFNAAYDYIKCGIDGPVVFNVNSTSGPYNEQLIMTLVPGSSNTNTITFNGNGRTLSFAPGNTSSRAVIKLDSAKHIRFDSLVINASAGTFGYGVHLIRNSDSNIVRNCSIITSTTATTQNYAGIVINGSEAGPTSVGRAVCDYNEFINNTITGGFAGITVVGTDPGGTNGFNRFVRNRVHDFYQYGFFLQGTYNTMIDSNTIARPTRTAINSFYGVYVTGSNISDTVSKNTIKQPFDGAPNTNQPFYGINFENVKPLAGFENYIVNNIVSASNGIGLAYGIANTASSNIQYYHNTVSIENTISASTAASRGFSQTTTADGIVFYDNLITIYRGGTGTKHCIYLSGTSNSFIADFNDYFIVPGTTNYVGFRGSNYKDLAAWKTAMLPLFQDQTSVSIDPVYVDTATEIYRPQNAAFDNKGINPGIPLTEVDIYSMPRDVATPDIGAVEFVPPPCSGTPTAGITLINGFPGVDTVCYNTPVSLGLQGNSFGGTQTFQWQTSPNGNAPWTFIGTPMLTPDTLFLATITQYYRAEVKCGSFISYSNPLRLHVTPALPTGTYTINKNSPTTYVPGIAGGNFVSFNDAKAAMSCGIMGSVVFNVLNGPSASPYNEQLILDTIPNTAPTRTVTFNGNGQYIAYSSASTNERAVIKLTHTKFIIFNNLVIDARGAGGFGFGVQLINNADSNIIHGCTILTDTTSSSAAYAGIVLGGSASSVTGSVPFASDGNIIDSNTVIGGNYGITSGSSGTIVMTENRITNNTVQDFYNYGIYVGAGNSLTLVEGNRITRPNRFNGQTTLYGINVTGTGSSNINVSRNRIYNLLGGSIAGTAASYGINFNDADATPGNSHIVANNLLYNFTGTGAIYGLTNAGSNYVNFYHNTVAVENLGTSPTGLTRGFNQNGTTTGTQFKNNIISIIRGGTGIKHAIYLGTPTNVESDYNDFYVAGDGTQNYIGFATSNRLTLADWQQATLQDAHSFSLDPGFTANYSPVVAPLDNIGTPLNFTVDVYGNPRNATTPDIGAVEFTVPPCGTITTTTATVTPNGGICVDVPITLDIPGSVSASGLTFTWENSPTGVAGTWTPISSPLFFPKFTIGAFGNPYYRAAINCNGTITYSSIVMVNMNLLLVPGTYTINKALPTNYTGTAPANFNSYADAVAVMSCGISGHVTFNVSSDLYTEQVLVHKIPGSSPTATITFQSASSNPSTSTLTYNATAGGNYVLRLDSAKYITFRNLTITATSATNGRVVEFTGNSAFDTLVGCIINAPVTTIIGNTVAGVYGNGAALNNIVVKGNTVNNGSTGIYLTGTNATNLSPFIQIDSNTISGFYNYGIYAGFTDRVRLNNNTVNLASPLNSSAYGIYATNCDTGYRILRNNVNINNVTSANVYGLYVLNSDAPTNDSGIVASNRIIAGSGNTGNVYGLINYTSVGNNTINNEIAIASAGTISYGLHSFNSDNINYYNNSVNISVTTAPGSYAAYFNHTAALANIKIRNNIFSNKGAGKALYINNATYFIGDYNNLYAAGASIVQSGTTSYPTLQPFITATNWEFNSIVFPPAFVSDTDLRPNLTNPDVWAIHGRGVQIEGNNYDFNNNPRPVTLISGVPDLGAYEFLPTVDPTPLIGIPDIPAPHSVQTFMYGSDTVFRVKWGAVVPLPNSVRVKRFSGVKPVGLPATSEFMYFYTKVEIPGGGQYLTDTIQQFYIDPWQGSIDDQHRLGLGRTLPSNAWVVGFSSTVDVNARVLSQGGVDYLDKFTGLINPYAPIVGPDIDSSNRGKRFWVAYPINQLNGGQDMVLYLSATQAANVQVKINGTTWVRNYSVPANTVRVSDILPKTGAQNAFINVAGLSNRGISITSDVPIVAYAHVYGSASSGATMLMPVGVWGYEYQTLGITQDYGLNSFAYYYVIADNDNTRVEITSVPGIGLQATTPTITPGTKSYVTLNKGEFFQVVASSQTQELSGSLIRSVANSQGKCYPIATFSGTSRTAIDCPTTGGSGGDFMMQQNFPGQAWGKRYLTAPSSASTAANALQTNVYRVAVKNPATIVRRNGTQMTGIQPGLFYEFESNTSDYIEANDPIMVAQYLTGACIGDGDPEMIYLSPIEQGIKNIGFYRNTNQAITSNYLTLIVPTAAVPSLKIYEGTNTTPVAPSYTYAHTQNSLPELRGVNYTVIVKRWAAAQQQVRVDCDSAFTAITYGLGSVESYGYNAGTLVKNLKAQGVISLPSNPSGNNSEFTCANTPFNISALIPVVPNRLTWQFSKVPINPNVDVTQVNPVPVDTIDINGTAYYQFTVNQTFTFPTPGVYGVPIVYEHPTIESCDSSREDVIYVQVLPTPKPIFSVTSPICEGDTTFYVADSLTENGLRVVQWVWKFHDNSTITNVINPYKIWAAGTYKDTLSTLTAEGCFGDTTRDVIVSLKPTVNVVTDSLVVCAGSDTSFFVLSPVAGTTYNWYDSANGVIPVATGDTFNITNVTGTMSYYVEAFNGCTSLTRTKVTVTTLPGLTAPQPATTIGASSITWTWPVVTGATAYQVSTDSITWTNPSSGSTGLIHTINNIAPFQSVCLWVRALGTTACETSGSVQVCGQVGCPTDTVRVVANVDTTCAGGFVTYTVQNPAANTTYYLYNAATGGTAVDSVSAAPYTFTINTLTSSGTYSIGGLGTSGCIIDRVVVTAVALPVLDTPVVTVTVTGGDFITYSWNAVPGAVSYQYSTTGAAGSYLPVTGTGGLTQTISSLQPLQSQTIYVVALGSLPCQISNSGQATGTTVCSGFGIQVVNDTLQNCVGGSVTMSVQNAQAGYIYNWFSSNGTSIAPNSTSYTTNVSTLDSFFVEATTPAGCISTRTKVVVVPLQQLAVPTIVLIDSTLTTLTFTWTNVNAPGGYQVSINGAAPLSPSSGPNGLTHIVTGLTPQQSVTIVVTALGVNACQNNQTGVVTGTTKVCLVLSTPLVSVMDSTLSSITFSWGAVSGANSYEVSTTSATSGFTSVGANTTYTVSGLNPSSTVTLYVRALGETVCPTSLTGIVVGHTADCIVLPSPTFTPSVSTINSITFNWNTINGVAGYQVSTDSVNWVTPSSGNLGLTHTVSGLAPQESVKLYVRALSPAPCPPGPVSSLTSQANPCVALPAPLNVTFVDSTSNSATFTWTTVTASGVTGYQVEVSIGSQPYTVIAASQTGTSITIPNLATTDSVRIRVTTLGGLLCENSITGTIGRGRAALDQVFIPNAFTPNGSGNPENERLRVYSNIIKDGRFMIFNQWGQKIYEANTISDMKSGWDGTFGGKPQPVGVYIFVGRFTLTNGSVIEKKGSINLVR